MEGNVVASIMAGLGYTLLFGRARMRSIHPKNPLVGFTQGYAMRKLKEDTKYPVRLVTTWAEFQLDNFAVRLEYKHCFFIC